MPQHGHEDGDEESNDRNDHNARREDDAKTMMRSCHQLATLVMRGDGGDGGGGGSGGLAVAVAVVVTMAVTMMIDDDNGDNFY